MITKGRTGCRSCLLVVCLCFLTACGRISQEDIGDPETGDAAVFREAETKEDSAMVGMESGESEEDGGEKEKGTRLLIVMDVSGSTGTATDAVESMMAATLALAEKAPGLLSVEYMGFHTEVIGPYSEMTEELLTRANAQTSVYAGFSGIDEWITAYGGESGEALAVIVFSDLFSSRNMQGERYRGMEEAQSEQDQIVTWLHGWQELIERDVLRICFVRYKSNCLYEEPSATLENRQTAEELRYGFQVMLEEDIGEQVFLDAEDIGIEEGIRDCLKVILRTMTGKKCRKWKDEGMMREGRQESITIEDNIWTLVIMEKVDGRICIGSGGRNEDVWENIGEEQCLYISDDFYLFAFWEESRTRLKIKVTNEESKLYSLQVK